jgi:hypothetical protein
LICICCLLFCGFIAGGERRDAAFRARRR